MLGNGVASSYPAVANMLRNEVANRGISSPLSILLDNQSILHTFQQGVVKRVCAVEYFKYGWKDAYRSSRMLSDIIAV